MSQIGEYVSISATNAGAIIDALTAQLREAQSMKDYYCGQVVQLTAETEAQAAEVKRLQGELEKGKRNEPARKFKVGDVVVGKSGVRGTIVSISGMGDASYPYSVAYDNGGRVWQAESYLSLAPTEAPDAALS